MHLCLSKSNWLSTDGVKEQHWGLTTLGFLCCKSVEWSLLELGRLIPGQREERLGKSEHLRCGKKEELTSKSCAELCDRTN